MPTQVFIQMTIGESQPHLRRPKVSLHGDMSMDREAHRAMAGSRSAHGGNPKQLGDGPGPDSKSRERLCSLVHGRQGAHSTARHGGGLARHGGAVCAGRRLEEIRHAIWIGRPSG